MNPEENPKYMAEYQLAEEAEQLARTIGRMDRAQIQAEPLVALLVTRCQALLDLIAQ